MGKRIRSLGIQFGNEEIHITMHAAIRFRSRVMAIPSTVKDMTPRVIAQCADAMRSMVGESTQVMRRSGAAKRIYLMHPQCVFVMTTHGTIVTVLSASSSQHQFAQSIKEVRHSKRTGSKRDYRNSRWRRISREQDTEEPRLGIYIDEDED